MRIDFWMSITRVPTPGFAVRATSPAASRHGRGSIRPSSVVTGPTSVCGLCNNNSQDIGCLTLSPSLLYSYPYPSLLHMMFAIFFWINSISRRRRRWSRWSTTLWRKCLRMLPPMGAHTKHCCKKNCCKKRPKATFSSGSR